MLNNCITTTGHFVLRVCTEIKYIYIPQGAHEDATDFMIRVSSSIGNLAKDWKGQLTEAELQSPI